MAKSGRHFLQIPGPTNVPDRVLRALSRPTIDQPDGTMPIGTWTPPLPGQQAPAAPAHNGASHYFKITAQQDGTFTVINTRNSFTKTYRAAGANATR